MISKDKITEIFCILDDFYKEFEQIIRENSITDNSDKKTRRRQSKLSQSEVMCIMILFHAHNARHLKHFYIHYVQKHLQSEFPETVSYNRFVELQQKAVVPLVIFLKTMCLGQCTGVSFIDSTPLRVCHTKREKQHKTFKGMSTTGWFYGFKLHLIINDKGEILDFMLTQANVDDREPLKSSDFHKRIFGKLFGDRGYISQDLFEKLFVDGVHLVTKTRKNMKNSLMHTHDKVLLRKRSLIETVNDQLKNICQIEHTRHRSMDNFCLILSLVLLRTNSLTKNHL